jgi:hypothetical protein
MSRTAADISILGYVLQAYIQLTHVCSWFLFVCPMWQALATSIVHILLLLGCNALKFHVSGIKRLKKHDIIQRQSKNLQKLGPLLLQIGVNMYNIPACCFLPVSILSMCVCVCNTLWHNTHPFVCVCLCQWVGIRNCLDTGHWHVVHSLRCSQTDWIYCLPSRKSGFAHYFHMLPMWHCWDET